MPSTLALPRVLEPEAMGTPDEVLAYDVMDHSEVNARFVVDFLKAHGPCRGGELLDVGTGPARIPINLCRIDPAARVLGVDLAPNMIARARENVGSAGLGHRVRLTSGDAKALSLPSGYYEAVLSNATVHHIADPRPALAELLRVVEPGGTLFVRDLCRPEDADTVRRLVSTYADTAPDRARAMFEASLLAALSLDEVGSIVRSLGLPDRGVAMTSDRHWTWVWSRPG
jgi:ubiquinone/menaquinone biosynthesis C-methylase UbiE